ncbi:MAG: transglutaminase domain-containing protein [bacterium]|nr:transglutaminase domain-containing protein [bacterium]
MTEHVQTLTVRNLEANSWDLYPYQEDVYLQSFERLPSGVAARLLLSSDLQDFSHFLFSTNHAPEQESITGEILLRFEDNHQPKHQQTDTTIRAISKTGKTSRTYHININYYPSELYAANGQTAPGYVIVRNTDLYLGYSRVNDWILHSPTQENIAFAQKTWGHFLKSESSDLVRAQTLARVLIRELQPHRGVPSDEINRLAPFDQYEFTRSGKSGVACENIAPIFCHACNALGIPCRIISMGRPHHPRPPGEPGYELRLSEGHNTTEIFSNTLNQWIWIDLTGYILGAYLGEEGPLTMAELYSFVNHPNRVHRLRLATYDPATDNGLTEPLHKSRRGSSVFNYFKRDQQFTFKKRVPASN